MVLVSSIKKALKGLVMKMTKTEAYEFGQALIDASAGQDTMQVVFLGRAVVAAPALNGEILGCGGVVVEYDPAVDCVHEPALDADNLVLFSA